jgi:hypothetical protein
MGRTTIIMILLDYSDIRVRQYDGLFFYPLFY